MKRAEAGRLVRGVRMRVRLRHREGAYAVPALSTRRTEMDAEPKSGPTPGRELDARTKVEWLARVLRAHRLPHTEAWPASPPEADHAKARFILRALGEDEDGK